MALAMPIMAAVVLSRMMVMMIMVMVMWGMLFSGEVVLILVATVIISFTDTAITTQVQICDLGGVKVKVICLNLCTTGIFSPVSVGPAVIGRYPAAGRRLQTRRVAPKRSKHYFEEKMY
jgi:hypothetical protein